MDEVDALSPSAGDSSVMLSEVGRMKRASAKSSFWWLSITNIGNMFTLRTLLCS